MKIAYIFIFFLGMLAISWLAYHLFQGIDNGIPLLQVLARVIALILAIVLLVLFIRHYVRDQAGPNDK